MAFEYQSSEDFFTRDFGNKIYETLPRPILVGVDIRTPSNIGGLIRLAGNIGAMKVIFAGTTSIELHHKKIRRVASNAHGRMEIQIVEHEQWKKMIPEEYTTVAIETAQGAKDLYHFRFPDKTALVVGSESNGIPDSILKNCDEVLYIPMPGHTLSLNVVQATGIAIFEWFRQNRSANL